MILIETELNLIIANINRAVMDKEDAKKIRPADTEYLNYCDGFIVGQLRAKECLLVLLNKIEIESNKPWL